MESLEARVGIEPTNKGFADLCLTTWLPRHGSQALTLSLRELGAGDGTRTRDIDLGKVALYQLSYSRRGYSLYHEHVSGFALFARFGAFWQQTKSILRRSANYGSAPTRPAIAGPALRDFQWLRGCHPPPLGLDFHSCSFRRAEGIDVRDCQNRRENER